MSISSVAALVGVPLGAAPLVYFVGRFGRGRYGSARPLSSQWAALAAIGLAAAAWMSVELDASAAATVWRLGGIGLRLDGLALLVSAITLGLGGLVVFFSGAEVRGLAGEEKYYALLLVEIGAVIALVCATDLFNLWVWFEVMAVASYTLVAFFREERRSLEAGVKYLVQSAIGSTLALLGIALVLSQTGSVDLEAIRAVAKPTPVFLAAGALMLAGFGTKAGLVPFHTWLPDAYSQSPNGISALLSGVVTKLGLIAALRAIAALAGVNPTWALTFMAFGVLGMVVGNLLAFRQRQLKRLLACSSLAHVGYALFGISIGLFDGQPTSAEGGLFHLLTHALMSGAAFLAVGALLYGVRQDRRNMALSLADLAGAAGRYPLVALALSLAVLGLGGVPPLAGFMSKWQIFVAGFDTHSPAIVALVVFAALNSVFSLAYYAPVVNAAYRHHASQVVLRGQTVPLSMTVPLVVLSGAIIVLGVWPGLANGLVAPAAVALVRSFGGG
jgi:proton-translocating NADH-quinone oxidoreductase chain N